MPRCAHRDTCKRVGKVTHECRFCKHAVLVCVIHKEPALRKMQDHVRLQHPVEFAQAIGVASGGYRHQGEGLAASPTGPVDLVTLDPGYDIGDAADGDPESDQ